MQYISDIVNKASVKRHPTDAISPLSTRKTDDADINEYLAIMAVATHEQKILSKITNNSPAQTQIEKK